MNLGIVHADLHEYDLADPHFAQAVHLRPDDLTARQRWAQALAEQGRVREAVFQYVAAVEIAPEDAALRHALAELYLKAGRPDAARTQWEKAALRAPMDATYAARLRSLGGMTQ
jgi:Flp pilus assembly protein TadD